MKYVSIKEASEMKGISERAMYKVSKLWGFWGGAKNNEIDIDNPEWADFVAGKRKRGKDRAEPEPKKKPKRTVPAQHGLRAEPEKRNKIGLSRDEAESEYLSTLSYRDQKIYYEAKRIQLDVKAREGELILRDLVQSVIESQAQNIDIFINMAEKIAPFICMRLERVGKEQEVKNIISQETTKNIQHFKSSLIRVAENYFKEKINE